MQVLPFSVCKWRVHALAELVTSDMVLQDPKYQELQYKNCTKEWVTKDAQHYLCIRMLSDSDDKITKGTKEVLKITSEERITSLGFVVKTLQNPDSKKKLTCKEQAKMIKKAVLDVKEDKKYLQEIKILLTSTEDFGILLAHKESKKKVQGPNKLTKMFDNIRGKKMCPWKIVRYTRQSDLGFKVTVVAQKEDVADVMKKILSESKLTLTGHIRAQGASGGFHGNQFLTGPHEENTMQGATGGHHGNQTDSRHLGESTTQGATGGHHGNQTDSRHLGESTTQGATGGHHGNQTDSRHLGKSTAQGATGGHHGNQTDSRHLGKSTTQGATGGHHGNQTDSRHLGKSTTQGATGGHHGNQTDSRHLGKSTTQDATGGYHGNQTDSRHLGKSTTQGATGGYHGNQTDSRHLGKSTTQGASGGHHGNQTDSRHLGESTTQGATGGHHGNQTNSWFLTSGQMSVNKNKTLHIQDTQTPDPLHLDQQQKSKYSHVDDMDIFESVEADLNTGIVQTLPRDMLSEMKELSVIKDGHIICKGLDSVQKVNNALQDKVSSGTVTVDDKKEHFGHSQDEFEHVADINFEMSEEIFLALQFFCRDETLMNQQSFGYKNGMLQINCTDKREKKNLETCIKSELQHIEKLNKDDVSFTRTEEPKIKGTISGINQDVDGVFCYQLKEDEHMTVHIMAHSYSQLQTAKHKIFLGIGRIKQSETRRNRRFDNTSLQQNKENSTLSERNRFSQSYHKSPTWQTPSNLDYGSVVSKDFTTTEGLLVRVYSGSILHLDVDCIVNAANGDLQHGGGVARVISSAAGYEFDKESRDYIARYGPLKVGEVCTTTAGDLKYKGVIHAVGPRWYDYGQDQKWECLHDLKTAVKNSLEEADFQRYTSIAIPAISSGIFGVPKEHCTQQYYRAVEEYSRTRGRHSTLTEVHFIDKDTQMCQLIQTTFAKCFSGDPGAASGGRHKVSSSVMAPRQNAPVLQRSNSLPSNTEGSSVHPSNLSPRDQPRNLQRSTSSGQCFEIGSNLTVHIITGNIVDIKADAIVSPENIQCDSTGRIAREITRVAGEGYVGNDQSELRLSHTKPKLTEVLDTLAGKSHFKYVLHVVAPKWDAAAVDDQRTYWKCLEQSYNNVFSTVDTKHLDVSSIAIPILGNGTVPKHPAPIISISKMLVEICKSYADKTPTKKTLYFCNDDTAAVYHLKGVFEKYFNKRNESKEDNRGQREDQKEQTVHDVTGQDQGSEVTEDCCICMDTMTKPKKLSCGHVFCTECIDQQFKYKPACPQCGAVHGKITGDQPPGTMTLNTTKSCGRHSYLPGYSGYGIINITYDFPSGKQGTDHPTPGNLYQGIMRPAYLPDNEKGRLVAKLLKIAFDRKLVFTIGRSRTTGHDGVVTWNDIHHKTRKDGGSQAFGYPDPTYLDRVLDELKAKGVTEESLNDP
ncbi:uncharacterized protein LOC117345222 [Pecten maximus]|uniref:uncharacterized protein LOC117345222 n=1 Tax=Pecten maximus TaxID=6579 RepID=UPI001458EE30|nr:uncharacterized protein LOC117345222 [Pecten maximus]